MFSLARLESEMGVYVELDGESRKARSALRSALDRDPRFAKPGRGMYRAAVAEGEEKG